MYCAVGRVKYHVEYCRLSCLPSYCDTVNENVLYFV